MPGALRMTLIGLVAVGVSCAQAAEPEANLAVNFAPGSNTTVSRPNVAGADQATLAEIVSWLSVTFELPASADYPRIELVPPRRIAAMRYNGMLGAAPQQQQAETTAPAAYQREVVAVYDDAAKAIFLPETWTGKTAAELSILLHEMVHHLQNLAGIKYECPAAREKLAYRAQDRWLGMHGLDLEQEFELDRFTIFVGSACFS